MDAGIGDRVVGSEHRKTVGSCAFEVVDYSCHKGLGVGHFIRSNTFSVGGFGWAIRFYPNGKAAAFSDHVAVYLEFMSSNAEALASYQLSLVSGATLTEDQSNQIQMCLEATPRLFRSCHENSRLSPLTPTFISKTDLEKDYVVGDRLTINCKVTVNTRIGIIVPPSDLGGSFATLLQEPDGADVTFRVGGVNFPAHKLIIAARCPMFETELYGQMEETAPSYVTVEDMQPAVFKALLHFIYTDSMPDDLVDLEKGDYCEILRQLLVAANRRYALDRLKLLCANVLANHLDAENFATTWTLADQHNCHSLTDACIEFLVSSEDMLGSVMATPGYANLKTTYPTILVDLVEKISKYRKA